MMVATGKSFASAPATAAVGNYNGSSCTGIGAALAITARHNGSGSTAIFGGVSRTVTQVIPHPSADIALLILSGTALSEWHALPTETPASTTPIMIGGFGFEGTVGGLWYGSRAERWVTNAVNGGTTDAEIRATFTDPAEDETTNEGVACMNDSGGAMVSSDGATVYGVIVHVHGASTEETSTANQWGATLYGADTCGVNLLPHVGWIQSVTGNPDGPLLLGISWDDSAKELTLTFDREFIMESNYSDIQINVGGTGYVGDSIGALGDSVTVTMVGGTVSVAAGQVFLPSLMFSAGGEYTPEITAPYVVEPITLPIPTLGEASTAFNTMSTATIYCAFGPGDVESTHFKIVSCDYGTLYLADGTTALSVGQFITQAQGAAGLRCQPDTGYAGVITLTVSSSTDAIGSVLSDPETSYVYVAESGTMSRPEIGSISATISQDTRTGTGSQSVESVVTFASSVVADITPLSDAITLSSPSDGFVCKLPNGQAFGASAFTDLIANVHNITLSGDFTAITTSVNSGKFSLLASMCTNVDGGEANLEALNISATWVANNTITPAGDGSVTFSTTDWTGTDALSAKRTRWANFTAPIAGDYTFEVTGTIVAQSGSTFAVYAAAGGAEIGTNTTDTSAMGLTASLTAGATYLLAFFGNHTVSTKTVGVTVTAVATATTPTFRSRERTGRGR